MRVLATPSGSSPSVKGVKTRIPRRTRVLTPHTPNEQPQPFSAFPKNRRMHNGISSYCRKCHRVAVLPTDVVNPADRRPVSDRAVRSAPVVVLEPVWQRGVAVSMRAVADALRPFALHRLVEALDLAVRPRPVGLGRQVADLASCE